MKKLFVLLLVLLVGCTLSSEENSSQTNKAVSSAEKKSSDQLTADMTCTDEDGDDKNTKGKAVMTYSTGQKESFSDYCPEKDEELFKAFIVEYTCEGNKPKENTRKCDGNMTCSKGVCV